MIDLPVGRLLAAKEKKYNALELLIQGIALGL
jgi:hypothetical protein